MQETRKSRRRRGSIRVDISFSPSLSPSGITDYKGLQLVWPSRIWQPQALQINEWPPVMLTLPWAPRDVGTLWQSIYNHMKTSQRPWLCVVVSWIQTSWMFGPMVEKGNVITGHQIMKKHHLFAKFHQSLCDCFVSLYVADAGVYVCSSIVNQGTLT